MKIISLLFLIIVFSSFQNDLTPKEVKEKAARIRTELLSGKQLPSSIKKVKTSGTPRPGFYHYYYYTIRKENNIIDSVNMSIDIMDKGDSFDHLLFDEVHLKNRKQDKSYVYEINKEGIIVWAYRTEPPKGVKPKVYRTDSSTVFMDPNPPIMEIHTDSANVPPPIKIPDNKTREMYNARLKATLDELDSILFKR